ncbi:Protein translocase subunit SecD [Paraconexibacter sp. AEG42_29]|uniref:Multifunctional fusion protein n=1 Tax=Paraconexibacter sp. AEG42_29 TaxID=2997339 RepID=A0AAU7AWI4_9ACTN
MTDRRRNLFILGLVFVLLIGSVTMIATKKTRLGLDLKGGVELTYEAKATKFAKLTPESIDRAIDIMRKRVDALGVSEPEIQRSGRDQITVSLPDVKNADDAEDQVGTTAQLFFYDWEANVVGKSGKPEPANFGVTGGPAAGQTGCLKQFDALARAKRRPAQNAQTSSTGGRWYLVDDAARKVVDGPDSTVRAMRTNEETIAAQKKVKTKFRPVYINEGTILVRRELTDQEAKNKDDDGNKFQAPDCFYVLNDSFALRGTDIKDPEQNFDQQTQAPNVTFNFTDAGRKKWQKTTREIAQRGSSLIANSDGAPLTDPQQKYQHFAIVLDNELVSAPYIDYSRNGDGIDGANGSEISGGFTIKTAQRLANELKYGALPVSLELISQAQVSATLGKQALNEGIAAGAAGFLIVALFLLIFYRVLGAIAVTALVVYSIYFFALIKLIPVTLTLPGIAGLILTIGVAADANIVIFERVKEEIRAGRSIPAGVAAGYKKGISAIIDANVVTFMTAFILFVLATAGVKGFALILGIGTLVSLFTAVLLTQAILAVLSKTRILAAPATLGASAEKKEGLPWRGFDFTGASKYFFAVSGVILLIGALAIGGKGMTFGIDFDSGTRIKAAFVQPTDEGEIREVLDKAGVDKSAEIQRVTDEDLGANAFQVSTKQLKPLETSRVVDQLDAAFQVRGQPDTTSIGPTFGNTVARGAIIAVIVSLLVISAYITLRFEWKYAVPVLIALMHDILIVAGVYSLTGREVTTSTVAALLTILGYSLYDTIIVFDRIRENIPRMPRAAFSQIVNRSMGEVFTRSLATSFSTGLPIFALFMFGGDTLKDFAFALLIGTLSGAYSSLFIAAPVFQHWKEREPVYRRRAERIRAENGGIVPAYATGSAGQVVEVAEKKRSAKRITTPDDPNAGVSPSEFKKLVDDLHVDAPRATTAQERDSTADATPEDLVMKDKPKRTKAPKPRNKNHGRPR